MQRDIAAGDFIEHAEFSGNLYGTRWAMLGALPSSSSLRNLEWAAQAGVSLSLWALGRGSPLDWAPGGGFLSMGRLGSWGKGPSPPGVKMQPQSGLSRPPAPGPALLMSTWPGCCENSGPHKGLVCNEDSEDLGLMGRQVALCTPPSNPWGSLRGSLAQQRLPLPTTHQSGVFAGSSHLTCKAWKQCLDTGRQGQACLCA